MKPVERTLLLGAFLVAPSTAVTALPHNLIVNGDAETGDLTGWTDVLGHGFSVFAGNQHAQPHAGRWCFHGGTYGPSGPMVSEAAQEVDLSHHASDIDLGLAFVGFEGYARSTSSTSGDHTDTAEIVIEYRDESGQVLESFSSGTALPPNAWVEVEHTRWIPATTRSVRIRLIARRQIGQWTDGFFDDLVLVMGFASHSYCQAKPNSLGCLPAISASGTPSFTAPSPFEVRADGVLNEKFGMLFYGTESASIPFQGGTLCVQAPIRRTPVQSSGGNQAPPADCSGSYLFDFNNWLQMGVDPELEPGDHVFAQYWSRDPGDAFGTGLTDALEFVLTP